MEEELILQQPADRRLGDNNALPPGPPGVELEAGDLEDKSAPPSKILTTEKEKSISDRSSRRRSPSGSPIRKRKTPSRTRRSPSPPVRSRGRRSPSPRRNRFRDYSPDRRPRYGGRRSPDRRRSPIRRVGGRYRGRGRSSSRSISRSPSPPPRRGGSGRWSPKKKPKSPPQQQPPPIARQIPQPPPATNQPPPQYGVMAPPPPQLYGGEAYGPPPGYNQYGVPPPQAGFVQPNDAYVSMQAQNTGFNTAYPPPGTWSVDAYGQQQWLPPPTQMQQMPPPPQQQPPPPMVVTQNAQPVPTNVPPPTTVPTAAVLSKHVTVSDEAPGTVDPNPQHDAVAQEAENQRDELKKQRTSYLKKTAVLKKELKMLKEQRKDLHSGGAPASPTTKGFIEENEKLQNQIQKKLSTIENVIDMLTGIIGEENLDKDDENLEDDDILKEAALSSLQKPHGDRGSSIQTTTSVAAQKKKLRTSSSSSSESSSGSSSSSSSESSSSETETPHNKEDEDDDSSPERLKKKVIESMKNKDKEVSKVKQEQQKGPNKKERFNYVFYDPEMHWCQTCNVFPKTAKDFLNHLHTKNHMDRESIDTPWHTDMVTDQFPAYENAPTKRTPIRGLTFFVPATAWFCKLCNIWMGDLHCASTHLKSQLHANRYNYFLEENPHYEVNWLADRQIALNEQKLTPLPQQITSVSTTAAERKKLKKDDDKTNKKRKKKSDKKQKKKKKKSNKKRKKDSDSTSSTSSDSSSSTDSDEPKKKKSSAEVKDNLDNPNPAVSIRLSMRKQENIKIDDSDVAPPPPPLKTQQTSPMTSATALAVAAAGGKWTVVQEGFKHKEVDRATDADDSIIQQWNTVQPVISESEKKLLEQLKGKLKNKSKDEQQPKSSFTAKADNEKENRDRDKDKDKDREKNERDSRNERDRGGRDRDSGRGRDDRERRTERRSRTRSPTRSRSRGRDYRRNVRRSLSRNRGRMSPRGWRNNRNRRGRSRSRSPRRRSRSNNDRRRRGTRSRSRSTSRSGSRVEKPVVRPAEFRPRVPEKDKEKDKKTSESKDKKDKAKPKSSSSTAAAANAAAGKKLPFIGKMPVFKKQTSGAPGENEKRPEDQQNVNQQAGPYMYNIDAANAFVRPPAPTAAQIQMAMMEDVYGNAPPFHPDAGMMVDYDDLMPDPVQFVNIMGQAPPPPPPQATEDDKDILPPGIDMEESEEFVPKPITDGPPPGKGPLPKDLEDALNIIFPGERKPGDESDTEEGGSEKLNKANGETQIINDEAVIKPEELAKDGIHLVTFEETSQLGLDEASQMSMNEPLQFNRPPSNPTNNVAIMNTVADMDLEDANSQNILNLNMADIVPPPPPETETFLSQQNIEIETEIQQTVTSSPPKLSPSKEEPINTEIIPDIIPMPTEVNCESELNISVEIETTKEEVIKEQVEEDVKEELEHNNFVHNTIDIDLADIPQPPPSPTESEKKRRQEELNDLAMLGIDADDMAAQCM